MDETVDDQEDFRVPSLSRTVPVTSVERMDESTSMKPEIVDSENVTDDMLEAEEKENGELYVLSRNLESLEKVSTTTTEKLDDQTTVTTTSKPETTTEKIIYFVDEIESTRRLIPKIERISYDEIKETYTTTTTTTTATTTTTTTTTKSTTTTTTTTTKSTTTTSTNIDTDYKIKDYTIEETIEIIEDRENNEGLKLPENFIIIENDNHENSNEEPTTEKVDEDSVMTMGMKSEMSRTVIEASTTTPSTSTEFYISRSTTENLAPLIEYLSKNVVTTTEANEDQNDKEKEISDRSAFNRKITQPPKSPVYVQKPVIIKETFPFATGQVFNSQVGRIIPAITLEEHTVLSPAGYSYNGFNYQDR